MENRTHDRIYLILSSYDMSDGVIFGGGWDDVVGDRGVCAK